MADFQNSSSAPPAVFFTEPDRYFAPEITEKITEFVTENEYYWNTEKYYNVIYPVKHPELFVELKPKSMIKKNKVIKYCSECYLPILNIKNDFECRRYHKSCHLKLIRNKWYDLPTRKLLRYDGSFFIDNRKTINVCKK